ncbi:MAG: NADPH-dependent glutamate synthase [Planctomycetota bacterium]
MREQEPAKRRHNFDEVPLGYDEETAIREASRCLACRKPKCVEGCPVEIDIPRFISLVLEGKFFEAAKVIRETNSLPAICGRVCPQETQCEAVCVLGRTKKSGEKGESVAIGRLERFVADYERERLREPHPGPPAATGKRVAVVGSGPAGLTAAGDLAKLGHEVTVFEALHATGGVLVYGIPEFRLPKAVVAAEISYLEKLGVRFRTNAVVGRITDVAELRRDYDAVFIGTGAGAPRFLDVPGENLGGVYSANEYLTRANLMKAYLFPEYTTPIIRGQRIIVFGGGNVAMDSARVGLRLGAEKVTVVYRRGREEMPARAEEVHHAEEEGVQLEFLAAPVELLGNGAGRVRAAKCLRMKLGEPDESGRRSPQPIPGSEVEVEADVVIVAIGNDPNPLIPRTTPGLSIGKRGTIVIDPETGATSIPGVYAAGDIVSGAATVIEAMGGGRRAAKAMHKFLMDER